MDEDRRIYVAVAVIAAVAVGSLFVGRGAKAPARAAAEGSGWRSRLSAFGLVTPEAAPAESAASNAASSTAPAGLSAPEPMMTKAATRLFSSPSSGTGGIAGSEPPAGSAPDASASTPRVNLVDSSPNFPGGGGSLSSGGLGISARGGSSSPAGAAGGRSGAAGSTQGRGGAGSAGAGPGGRGTGPGAAGDATAAGKAAQAFNGSTDSKLGFKGGTGGALSGDRGPAGGAPGGADSKTPGLPDVAAGVGMPKDKSAGSAAAAQAGGGGGASAGGGGSGAGSSGAPPAAEAKMETPGGPSGWNAGPTGGSFGPGGPDAPAASSATAAMEVIAPPVMAGVPDTGRPTAPGRQFKLKNGTTEVRYYERNGQSLIGFRAPMSIDSDGPGGSKEEDPFYSPNTSLRYSDAGRSSVNARVIPYVVVSQEFLDAHKGVKMGDWAAVSHGGKTVYAVVADVGPALGEASQAAAAGLPNISPNPRNGGQTASVIDYLIAPGTAKRFPPPKSGREAQVSGRAIFEPVAPLR